MPMSDASTIARLREQFDEALAAAASERDLQAVRDRFLGRRSGAITALFADLGKVPPEARREFGRLINELKSATEAALDARRDSLAVHSAIRVVLP